MCNGRDYIYPVTFFQVPDQSCYNLLMNQVDLMFLIAMTLLAAGLDYRIVKASKRLQDYALVITFLALACFGSSFLRTKIQTNIYLPSLGPRLSGVSPQRDCEFAASENNPCIPQKVLYRGYPFPVTQQPINLSSSNDLFFPEGNRTVLAYKGRGSWLPIFGDYTFYLLLISCVAFLLIRPKQNDSNL